MENSVIATALRAIFNSNAIKERHDKEVKNLKKLDFTIDYGKIVFWLTEFGGNIIILFAFTFDALVIGNAIYSYLNEFNVMSFRDMLYLSIGVALLGALMIQIFLIGGGKRAFVDLFSSTWVYSRKRFFMTSILLAFCSFGLLSSYFLSDKGLPAAAGNYNLSGQDFEAEKKASNAYYDKLIAEKRAEKEAEKTTVSSYGTVISLQNQQNVIREKAAKYQRILDKWERQNLSFKGMPDGWTYYNYTKSAPEKINKLEQKIITARESSKADTKAIDERYATAIAALEKQKTEAENRILTNADKAEGRQDILVGVVRYGNIGMNFLSFLLLMFKGFYLAGAMEVDVATHYESKLEYKWSPIWIFCKVSDWMDSKGKDSIASRLSKGGMKGTMKRLWNGSESTDKSRSSTPQQPKETYKAGETMDFKNGGLKDGSTPPIAEKPSESNRELLLDEMMEQVEQSEDVPDAEKEKSLKYDRCRKLSENDNYLTSFSSEHFDDEMTDGVNKSRFEEGDLSEKKDNSRKIPEKKQVTNGVEVVGSKGVVDFREDVKRGDLEPMPNVGLSSENYKKKSVFVKLSSSKKAKKTKKGRKLQPRRNPLGLSRKIYLNSDGSISQDDYYLIVRRFYAKQREPESKDEINRNKIAFKRKIAVSDLRILMESLGYKTGYNLKRNGQKTVKVLDRYGYPSLPISRNPNEEVSKLWEAYVEAPKGVIVKEAA